MAGTTHQDIQSSISNAVKMQLTLLDVSVNYWQTLFGLGVTYTELCSRSMQSIQSGDPQFAENLQRFVDLGVRSSSEFGKLAVDYSSVLIEIAGEMSADAAKSQKNFTANK